MARNTQAKKKTGDWRDNIIADLPDEPLRMLARTHPAAWEAIKVAAYNRRMGVADFVGRAALAVAIYDSDGELDWHEINKREPIILDMRRTDRKLRRMRGNGFGPWKIKDMHE